MASFTSEEIQGAVNKYLTTQITSAKTATGARDTLAMRDSAYELLTSALLLKPGAYFYLVWQCSNRARGLLTEMQTVLATIDELAQDASFRTKAIGSTTELSNARAAVLQLSAGLNTRTTGIQGAIGPAVDRFSRSVGRFIDAELSKNVIRSGQIRRTPEQVQTEIGAQLANYLSLHAQLVELSTSLEEAIARLNAVQLPQQALTNMVGRISAELASLQEALEGDDALAQSRDALLQLFAMRALLTRASTFSAPEPTLAPNSQLATLSGPATPPSFTGTVSAPYNLDDGDLLRIEVGTGPATEALALPGGARPKASLTATLYPVTVAGFLSFFLATDESPYFIIVTPGTYNNAADLASAFGSVTGVAISSDGNDVVFTRTSVSDDAFIEIDVASTPASFWALFEPVIIGGGIGEISASQVAEQINATSALVTASAQESVILRTSGLIQIGLPNIVNVASTQGVQVGDRVRITGSADSHNDGLYRVNSLTDTTITLDRTPNSLLVADDNVTLVVERNLVTITGVSSADMDGVAFFPPDPGTVELGLPVSATQTYPTATTITPVGTGIDYVVRGVSVGDQVTLFLGSGDSVQTVTSVAPRQLGISPGAEYEFPNEFDYRITNKRYADWVALAAGSTAWKTVGGDISSFELEVGRLTVGAAYSVLIQQQVAYQLSALSTYATALDAYAPPREASIANITRMLAEQGMDRALDLLVTLSLEEFFTMQRDSVSYSTHLIRTAADVTREVAPVGKQFRALPNLSQARLGYSTQTRYDPNGPNNAD